jgi:carbohydrate-binding DOMON domain-containing protein
MNFLPDWSCIWSAKEAEKELIAFEFKGPGWYFTKTDSILVMPHNRTIDRLWVSSNELFEFNIYNRRNPLNLFITIANAPVILND